MASRDATHSPEKPAEFPGGSALPSDAPNPQTARPEKLWTGSFVAITIVNFFNFFAFNIMNTGMPIYVSMLGASTVQVGLVITLLTVTALIVRPFTGIILDRFGRKGILVISIVFTAAITAAYLVFPIVGFILSLRLFHGIGWGFSSTATSTVASDILPKSRFAEGMGFFAMANSVAVAIAPALAIELLDSAGAAPMIGISFGSLAIAFVLAAAMKIPKIGCVPKTVRAAKAQGFFDERPASDGPSSDASAGPTEGASASARPAEARKAGLSVADMFERRALLPGLLIMLMNMAFSTITTFIAVFAQSRGVDGVSLYFVTYAIVTIVTRPLIGRVIDRIGFFGPGILSMAGVVVTMLIISASTTTPMFVLAGLFAGLGLGTGMSVMQTMAVSSVEPHKRGVANSTYFFMFDLGIALGSFVSGLVAGAVGYSATYVVMAAWPLIALAVFLIAGRTRINSYSVNLNRREFSSPGIERKGSADCPANEDGEER